MLWTLACAEHFSNYRQAGPLPGGNQNASALLELFQGMSDEQQDAFFQATAALAQPVNGEADDEAAGMMCKLFPL